MKKRYLVVLINFLTILFLLMSVEVVSRIILKKIYDRKFDSRLITGNNYFSSSGLKENAAAIVWGKEFHTDEFGGRKLKRTFDRKKKTLVYIGDSVTEGVGVNDSSTFASLIADKIDSVNVINLSMIGWSISDYLNVARSILADSSNPLNIERISICYCLNDVYGSAATKDLPAVGNKGIISVLNAFLQDRYMTYKLIKLLMTKNSDHYYRYDAALYDDKQDYFKRALSFSDSICDLCKSKKIDCRLYVLPYKSEFDEAAANKEKGITLFSSLDEKLKVLGKNCSERSADSSHESPGEWLYRRNPKEDFNSLYLFADEIHFSEKGHRALADYLLTH